MLAASLARLSALEAERKRCFLEYVANLASVFRFADELRGLRRAHLASLGWYDTTGKAKGTALRLDDIKWVGSAFEAPALRYFGEGPSSVRGRDAWLVKCAARVASLTAMLAYANDVLQAHLPTAGSLALLLKIYQPLECEFLAANADWAVAPANDRYYFEREGFMEKFVSYHMSKLGRLNAGQLEAHVSNILMERGDDAPRWNHGLSDRKWAAERKKSRDSTMPEERPMDISLNPLAPETSWYHWGRDDPSDAKRKLLGTYATAQEAWAAYRRLHSRAPAPAPPRKRGQKRDRSEPAAQAAPPAPKFPRRRLWSVGDLMFYVGGVAYVAIKRRQLLPAYF